MVHNTKCCNQPMKSDRKKNTYKLNSQYAIISSRSMPVQNRNLCQLSILLEFYVKTRMYTSVVKSLIFTFCTILAIKIEIQKHNFTSVIFS